MRRLALALLLASPVSAVRLFHSGWENQSVVALGEWSVRTGTAQSIDTTIKRSGVASMKVVGAASNGYMQHTPIAAVARDVYLSVWLYIPTGGGTDVTTTILMYQTYPYIRLRSDRTLECWDSGAQEAGTSSAIPLDEWHQVKLRFNDPGANNDIECYLDSTMFSSGAGADLNGGSVIKVGPQNNFTGTLYFDDVIFNDATGATDTGFPTTNKIVHIRPNGAGDITDAGITLAGDTPAATAWESVDETTTDGYVTESSMTVAADRMDFSLTGASDAGIGAEDTINLVAAGAIMRTNSATTANITLGLKTQANGIVSTGTATGILAVTWAPHDDSSGARIYKLQQYTDPQAGGAWTTSLLDSTQLRVFTTDATPDVGVTQAWALVDYIDNAVGGTAPANPRRVIVIQ